MNIRNVSKTTLTLAFPFEKKEKMSKTPSPHIMHSYPSAEVLHTFAIAALISFLRKSEPELLAAQLAYVGLGSNILTRMVPTM